MDERPRHDHLTRDVKQAVSGPAGAALLALQHGVLSAAEVGRPGWLDQVRAPGHDAWLREQGGPDLHDGDAVAAGTVTVAGLRHVPGDIAVRSAAVWDAEF